MIVIKTSGAHSNQVLNQQTTTSKKQLGCVQNLTQTGFFFFSNLFSF
jgi:hypothetical protein